MDGGTIEDSDPSEDEDKLKVVELSQEEEKSIEECTFISKLKILAPVSSKSLNESELICLNSLVYLC